MLNRIVLMGRLTANPELKSTTTGKSVTSFSIAVERNYNKSGEERKVDFFNVVCWNYTAEFVCRYFAKGNMIALEGKLQSRTYQANDGSTRYVTEIVADTVSLPVSVCKKQTIIILKTLLQLHLNSHLCHHNPILKICLWTMIYRFDN